MGLRTATMDQAAAVAAVLSLIAPLDDPEGAVPEATGGLPVVLFGATLPVV
jgi:hypothetical protein